MEKDGQEEARKDIQAYFGDSSKPSFWYRQAGAIETRAFRLLVKKDRQTAQNRVQILSRGGQYPFLQVSLLNYESRYKRCRPRAERETAD